jgi:hypothetical protein
MGKVGEAVGYGIMVYLVPAQAGHVQLRDDTAAYLKQLTKSSPNVKTESEPSDLTVGGAPALLTRFSSDSPYQEQRETDVVLTVVGSVPGSGTELQKGEPEREVSRLSDSI